MDDIRTWMQEVEAHHGVDAAWFLGLYAVAHVGGFYMALFRFIGKVRRRRWEAAAGWLAAALLCYLAPYLYVYAVGRNLPEWFHYLFGLVVVLAAVTIVRRVGRPREG